MIGVGDLVVCVDDSPCRDPTNFPSISLSKGRVYRVSAVVNGLLVDGEPPHDENSCGLWGWDEARFRKVIHDRTEACETEFVTLLKRSKKPVSA